MNEFTTIFEVTALSLRADALLHFSIGGALIIGGIVGLIFHRRMFEEVPVLTKVGVSLIMVMLGLAWLAVHVNLFSLATSDINGQSRTVEGVVRVSSQQPFGGHTAGDKITVGGQKFVVDYFYETPGYNRTIAHGGALCNGVYARIRHYYGMILKVEVRADANKR